MSFPTSFTSNTAKTAAGRAHILKFTGVHVGKSIEFLAFIESFSQNFTSTWNTENVYGRNDPIGTFQGTQRTISLSWTIPSSNAIEARDNLSRAGSLAQLLYPYYSSKLPDDTIDTEDKKTSDQALYTSNALTLSKPPLIRLKYANLINDASKTQDGLLGWIGSLSWTPTIEMGTFEIGSRLYPKVIVLNVDFTVVHEHDLGWTSGSVGGFDKIKKFPFGG